jgi:hypothetical protein
MQERLMDKTRLAAFADGELSPEEAAAVVMHLADHPADQAYVDDLMAANAALAAAFSGPMSEPVPPALRAMIDGTAAAPAPAPAKVIAFAPRRRVAFAGGFALAASLALAAVLLPGGPEAPLAPGPLASGQPIHDLLDSMPSGQERALGAGRRAMVLATLPTPDGLCREVEILDRAAARLERALACHGPEGWRIEVALAEPLEDDSAVQGFIPATGAEGLILDPWLDRLGAGMALDAAAEAAWIARGWR